MRTLNRHTKKIFSIIIILILTLTVLAPSFNSEQYVKDKPISNIQSKSKDIISNLLNNLIGLFPFFEEVPFFKALLEYFSDRCVAEIEIIKDSDLDTAKIGDTITYTYKVINKGDFELFDIYLTDDKLGEISLNNTVLAPGDWAYGEKTYVVENSDLPGPIVNIATVNASYTNDEGTGEVEDSDELSISIDENVPLIDIIKEADKETVGIDETITYQYKVINIGETWLYDIKVDDDLLGPVSLNKTSLAPGNWSYGELTYTVTVEDCDSTIVNVATANGSYCIPGEEGFVTDTDTESVTVECDKPEIDIEKQANIETAKAGDTIIYTYNVTNTGDIPLSDIYVIDDKLGSATLAETHLEPGEWTTGELCYTVTIEDCGKIIINNATVNGSYCDIVGSGYVEDTDTESVSVICGKPKIDLQKRSSTNTVSVGETVTYYYLVYNTGAVVLFDIKVTDDPLGEIELNTTTLAPGDWAYGEKTYTVKESDYPYPIENKAVAEGYTSAQQRVVDSETLIIYFEIPCQEHVWVDNTWQDQSDVNEYNPDLYWEINAFNNFEDAIDIVCECGTVHVLPGYYSEQILIDKSLNLIAEGDVTIVGSDPQGYTIDDSTEVFKPIIFAFGGKLAGTNVETTKKISVLVDGFYIDGSDKTIAILYHNVESGCTPALITNNIIENSQVGIQIQGCTDDTTITWNEIIYAKHTINKIGILIESINDCEPDNVEIHHNKIGIECGNNIGIWNTVSNIVDAEFNWWGSDDGPESPDAYDNYDAITGRIADGFGDEVRGQVHFDPWAGVESSGIITEIYYPVNEPHYYFEYDASDSFGYSLDGSPLDLEYWWNFGDNHYSTSKTIRRRYDEPGTYSVSLKVSAIDQDLDPTSKLTDTSYYKVTQRPE